MSSPPASGSRPRLLIADDDPVVQSVLGASLQEEFEIVGVAADSTEAVELARASQPDAALVDVEMPGGGGITAVRGIAQAAPGAAIVILSGDESDAVVRELMSAGATAYRRKGVAPDVLAESLRESIKAHAAARQAAS